MDLRITHHARRRFRQRVGLPARAVRKAAATAFYEGTPLSDLPTPIADKLTRMADRHRGDSDFCVMLYRGHPYCFLFQEQNGNVMTVLVTVLPAYLTEDNTLIGGRETE